LPFPLAPLFYVGPLIPTKAATEKELEKFLCGSHALALLAFSANVCNLRSIVDLFVVTRFHVACQTTFNWSMSGRPLTYIRRNYSVINLTTLSIPVIV
jgi:hypothetical protein